MLMISATLESRTLRVWSTSYLQLLQVRFGEEERAASFEFSKERPRAPLNASLCNFTANVQPTKFEGLCLPHFTASVSKKTNRLWILGSAS